MPELPEVETVRRGLAAHVVGRRVVEVRIGRERSVRRTGPDEAVRRLTGAVISGARRHGKYLQCPLDTGDALMVHLRMSGQLLLAPVGAPLQPHTHVVAVLEANDSRPAEELRFVDPRTFGEFVVYDEALAGDVVPELARLGPDPLTAADPRWAGNDPRYRHLKPEQIPATECLRDTVARVVPFWSDSIAPALRAGRRVLVAAHGNSLRALIKYLDGLSDDEIVALNVPTARPLVYELDDDLKPIRRYYLGDPEEIARAMAAVAAQGKASAAKG